MIKALIAMAKHLEDKRTCEMVSGAPEESLQDQSWGGEHLLTKNYKKMKDIMTDISGHSSVNILFEF